MSAFLRIDCGPLEWGFDVKDGYIPAIGDTVTLWHAPPDDVGGANREFTDAVVIKRTWSFAHDFRDWDEVYLDVALEAALPEGHVPDSTAWPASEYSAREREHLACIERIRSERRDND